MNKEHVPFNRLSDLCDDVLSPKEREEVMRHVESCPGCSRDHGDIEKLIRMVSCLQYYGMQNGDEFTRKTLDLIKRRKKLYYYKRIVPYAAVAAMMIFVIGVDQLKDGAIIGDRDANFSGNRINEGKVISSSDNLGGTREVGSNYDIRKTLSILRENHARIVTISDSFIDVEAPAYRLDNLRREFEGSSLYHPRGWATNVNISERMSREESPAVFHGFMFQSGNNKNLVRLRVNLQ